MRFSIIFPDLDIDPITTKFGGGLAMMKADTCTKFERNRFNRLGGDPQTNIQTNKQTDKHDD